VNSITTLNCQAPSTDLTARVLLIEDSFDDQQFVIRASRKIGYDIDLRLCTDGEEALCFVNREGIYSDAELPDFVLLDLNLPGLSGLEVLEAIRAHEFYASIPVVVFSSSSHEEDVKRAWRLGCSSFFQKPSNPTLYMELLSSLCAYWKSGFHLLPEKRRGRRGISRNSEVSHKMGS